MENSGQIVDLEEAIKSKIAREINIALQDLGAPFDLLFIIGGWGDVLSDQEVLDRLRRYNQRAEATR